MKSMKKFAAQQLTKKAMNEVLGGKATTREEYCATLLMIVVNNKLDDKAMEGARIGWEKNCK